MTDPDRWGGAQARVGATDTTMLVWKVIDANSGITRPEIFAKIEDQIPSGYAIRRYAAAKKSVARAPATLSARSFVLTETLSRLIRYGSVAKSADTKGYWTLRPIKRYFGDPAKVDETGTAAAEHLNTAYAIKTVRAAGTRVNPRNPRLTAAEWAAALAVAEWAARRMTETS